MRNQASVVLVAFCLLGCVQSVPYSHPPKKAITSEARRGVTVLQQDALVGAMNDALGLNRSLNVVKSVSGIASTYGGGVLSNNGGGVVSNNGGRIVATARRLLQAGMVESWVQGTDEVVHFKPLTATTGEIKVYDRVAFDAARDEVGRQGALRDQFAWDDLSVRPVGAEAPDEVEFVFAMRTVNALRLPYLGTFTRRVRGRFASGSPATFTPSQIAFDGKLDLGTGMGAPPEMGTFAAVAGPGDFTAPEGGGPMGALKRLRVTGASARGTYDAVVTFGSRVRLDGDFKSIRGEIHHLVHEIAQDGARHIELDMPDSKLRLVLERSKEGTGLGHIFTLVEGAAVEADRFEVDAAGVATITLDSGGIRQAAFL